LSAFCFGVEFPIASLLHTPMSIRPTLPVFIFTLLLFAPSASAYSALPMLDTQMTHKLVVPTVNELTTEKLMMHTRILSSTSDWPLWIGRLGTSVLPEKLVTAGGSSEVYWPSWIGRLSQMQ